MVFKYLSVDFDADNIRLAIWSLYLILLTVTAVVSVFWILKRQRSSVLEGQCSALTPFLEYKSIESTMNDSKENAFRQPFGDLGKEILDQQSEEGDANGSPNNINFSQELASLKYTADGKFTVPQNKSELSTFTEHSKSLGNYFTALSIGDNSGRIDVYFPTMQQVEKNDLDELEKDLERVSSDIDSHGPFNEEQNISEHIEVDLNMTHTVDANGSPKDIDFYEQPASLECTAGNKLTGPQNKFELSTFTEQSKRFGNDIIAPPIGGDNSGRIDVNFSEIKLVGKDLERASSNMDCYGTFSNTQNTSEHVEVETNMTHTVVTNDKDMSIKNTGRSPVQDVSKNGSKEKKASLNNDLVADKVEYTAINAYGSPSETNFIADEEPSHVLVFDGKRLTFQPDITDKDKNYGETVLSNSAPSISGKSSQNSVNSSVIQQDRKDDLDEIEKDLDRGLSNVTRSENIDLDLNMTYRDAKNNEDISIMDIVNSPLQDVSKCASKDIKVSLNKDLDADKENIASNPYEPAPCESDEELKQVVVLDVKRSTLMSDILEEDKDYGETLLPDFTKTPQDNISVSQTLISNILAILQPDDNKENSEAENILNTQLFLNNIVTIDSKSTRHRMIVYENYTENISITRVKQQSQRKLNYSEEKPNVHLRFSKPSSKKRTKVFYDNDDSHICMTEYIISANKTAESRNESKSIVYNGDTDGIHRDLATSANNYFLDKLDSVADTKKPEEVKEKIIDDDVIEESINKIKTIVDTNEGDIFMTGAISESTNIVEESTKETKTITYDEADYKNLGITTKSVYLFDELDSSADVIKPIKTITSPCISIHSSEHKEIKEKVIDSDVSEQDNLEPTEDALQGNRKSAVFDAKNFDSKTSRTVGIAKVPSLLQTEERKTVIFGNDYCNISMKHPTQAELITDDTGLLYTTITKSLNLITQNRAANPQSDLKLLQALTTNSKQLTASKSVEINLENPLDHVQTVKVQKANSSSQYIQKVISLTVIPLHSRDTEKLQVKLMTSTTDQNIDTASEGENDYITKESLSNISDQTLQSVRSSIAILVSDPPSAVVLLDVADNTSIESMFYIMKNSEVVTQKEIKNLEEEEQVIYLQRKLSEFKIGSQNSSHPSRSLKILKIDKATENVNNKQQRDNSSIANDTQALLDSISNFTDCIICENNVQPVFIKVKDQGETTEDKQLSVTDNGQCKAFSPKDLLRNILMAQALLQQCRQALDDSNCEGEDTRDASVEISNEAQPISYELDKTFQNGDIFINEASLISEEECSTLRKTAFGETSSIYETKEKVIPTFFEDIPDGIKDLMLDLVKPVSNDIMSVRIGLTDRDVSQNRSHSTQIQANLATSSHEEENTLYPKLYAVKIFDHASPLNNVLFAPNYLKDRHKYNPRQTNEMRCNNKKPSENVYTGINYEAEQRTRQDDICVYQKDDRSSKKFDSQFTSTTSICSTVHQSVETISRQLRNEEVNTIIKMRKNEEILRASLSLELVEDTSEEANRVNSSDSNKPKNLMIKVSISPHINIKGEATKIVKAAKLSGVSIRQRLNSSNSHVKVTHSKTRLCSTLTEKNEQYSSSEKVTPKQITKNSKSPKPPVLPSPTKQLRTEETFYMFVEQSFRPTVSVFDHLTPVNNILHYRTDLTYTHKDDRKRTNQTLFDSASNSNRMSKGDYEVEEVLATTQMMQIDSIANIVRRSINDESESENRLLTPDNEHTNHRIKSSRSPLVDLEGQAADIDSIAKITTFSLEDQFNRTNSRANRVKNTTTSTNMYKQYLSTVEDTRKPISQIRNFSTNSKSIIEFYLADDLTHSMAPEKDVIETNSTDAHLSKIYEKKSIETKKTSVLSVDKPCTSAVLVFDPLNHLNSIRCAPTYFMDVHKYNPSHTDEKCCGSESGFDKTSGNEDEVETVTTTQYNTRIPEPKIKQDVMYNIYQKYYSKFAPSTSELIFRRSINRRNFNPFKRR